MITVDWKQSGLQFQASTESGHSFVLDGYPEEGQSSAGPTPVETLMTSLAACMAMDVISILQKKKQEVSSYRVEIEGVRAHEGTWPRPFTQFRMRHIVSGKEIDRNALARAVELSDQKYCTVAATIRQSPEITSELVIEAEPVSA